jgi:uncharacterized membrane protein
MSTSMPPPARQPGAPLHPMPPPPDAVSPRTRRPQLTPAPASQHGPTPQGEEEERQYAVSRLVNFSDGVFAFAMTLLVVNLLPFADFRAAPSPAQFFQQLFSSAFIAGLVSFVLSALIIGHAWYLHHTFFRYIITSNLRLFQLNLAVLLVIAFLPFPTDLLSQHDDAAIIAAFYAGTLALLNVLMQLLWWYASAHHRLVRPTLEQQVIRSLRLRLLLTLPLLLLSIGFAFLSLYLAIATWVATLFVRPLVAGRHSPFGKKGARHG